MGSGAGGFDSGSGEGLLPLFFAKFSAHLARAFSKAAIWAAVRGLLGLQNQRLPQVLRDPQ